MRDARRPVVAVVDDDEAVRDSLRFLLETAGFEVTTFATPDAFLLAATHEVTFVLVDQHMPHMTGLDVLARLRERGSTLQVALMTGSPSSELTRRAQELGAVAVMDKPLHDDMLLRFLAAAPA